ncbi:MAG: hypothetical protein R2735_01400 [Microthrixaceae bacterium]
MVFRYQLDSPSKPGSATDGIDGPAGIDGLVEPLGIDAQHSCEVIRSFWMRDSRNVRAPSLKGNEVMDSLRGWSIDQELSADVIEIRAM